MYLFNNNLNKYASKKTYSCLYQEFINIEAKKNIAFFSTK